MREGDGVGKDEDYYSIRLTPCIIHRPKPFIKVESI